MIPKLIHTGWLNSDPEIPENIQACIESQKIPGYHHITITLENCYRDSAFVRGALSRGDVTGWVKAIDYLRAQYLYLYGGIYLDADVTILPGKNFDDVIDECGRDGYRMFVAKEPMGHMYGTAVFGCEPGHPVLWQYMKKLDENFKGEGPLVFDSGIRGFNDVLWVTFFEQARVKEYPTDYFYPYHHINRTTTITNHHFLESWIPA